tara:strand:- start:85 stop:2640 length:2556 start_codon:yes stop_codon:yes gene_type:complete
MSIQQLMLGSGGASEKTYLDDVFSTYVYGGNSTARSINNGLNLSGEGGMTWIKSRDNAYDHYIVDTERGALNRIRSNSSGGSGSAAGTLTAFNNNGFSLGSDSTNLVVNASNKTYSSWSFRRASGFFDVVTWTGNSDTNQTINHSLKSIPGCIMAKRTDQAANWTVYHRGTDGNYSRLNSSNATTNAPNTWQEITSSSFRAYDFINVENATYVAYVFAGGESTAATARSVDMDGSNDYLTLADSDDWDLGQTFTIEAWVKLDALNNYNVIIAQAVGSGNSWYMSVNSNGSCQFYDFDGTEQIDSAAGEVSLGQWTHVAIVNNSGTAQWYINGIPSGTAASLNVQGGSLGVSIGSQDGSYKVNGKISNLRLVKGTAVYTSAFRPPTKPLTNITNTKLLCCNNSSTTGSTVTTGTITASGSPTASTDSPFDDPAGFVFGDAEDQNVIKCGSYVGNGNNDGVTVELGWEPQYILVKCTDLGENWYIMDSMRGIISGGPGEPNLIPNSDTNESIISQIDLTPTGFKCANSDDKINGDGHDYIYVAIRRPDGYVGKPAEAGTDVFAMDTGAGSSTIPNFDSGFVVDMALAKPPAATENWYLGTRLQGSSLMYPNTSGAEVSATHHTYDSNVGWNKDSGWDSSDQSWMWKRHAGFDVVTAKGGQNKRIAHSLNKIPEMYWVKNRDAAENWTVYHKGLNSGTNPENRYIIINSHGEESGSDTSAWNSFVPTSTHISFGTMNSTGGNSSHNYLVMLFASVDGISKIGYYDGSNSAQTITTGFQPRFAIIRRVENTDHWFVLDTLNGWGSGNDHRLRLSLATAEGTGSDYGAPTSTGFSLTGNMASTNTSGGKYIYYAHA